MIVYRSFSETLQQNGKIEMCNSRERYVTNMDQRDRTSRILAGMAAYRHDILHVYSMGEEISVRLNADKLT